MGFVRSLLIVLLANQASIATAVAGERTILREPDAVVGQKHPAGYATKDARVTPVTPLDRVATAVDGAESSHGKDIAMWRPDPSGPQGPMQVGEAAATDVGGGDRFNLTQNRAIGRAYLDATRTGLTLSPLTIGASATSIPGSEPDDHPKNYYLVWRRTRRGSYTIAVFATALRQYSVGDRRH
jgi:hypothetical protein